jgi:hypothetical protein
LSARVNGWRFSNAVANLNRHCNLSQMRDQYLRDAGCASGFAVRRAL